MLSNQALCLQIRKIYPEIGACGIDLAVDFEERHNRWVVYLTRNGKRLKTNIAPEDVEKCMQGKQCVGLGIEINQLKDSIERMPSR